VFVNVKLALLRVLGAVNLCPCVDQAQLCEYASMHACVCVYTYACAHVRLYAQSLHVQRASIRCFTEI